MNMIIGKRQTGRTQILLLAAASFARKGKYVNVGIVSPDHHRRCQHQDFLADFFGETIKKRQGDVWTLDNGAVIHFLSPSVVSKYRCDAMFYDDADQYSNPNLINMGHMSWAVYERE